MRIYFSSVIAILAFLSASIATNVAMASPLWNVQTAQTNEIKPLENDQTEGDVEENVASPAKPTDGEISANNPPDIITDLSTIPFSVKKMRDLILEAAKTGDVEKLRPYIGSGDDVTMLSLGGFDEDPIDFLRSLSGDSQGQEILAIMSEILEAPLVKLNPGNDDEMYVWPYFYAYPSEKLTPAQRVELFRIITYGDFEEMETFGNYIFYRIGITAQGRWRFFVAGD
jgi:hypothetical protein